MEFLIKIIVSTAETALISVLSAIIINLLINKNKKKMIFERK